MSASPRLAKDAGSVMVSTLALRSAATQLRSIARYLEEMLPEEIEQPQKPKVQKTQREKGGA